MTGSLSDMDMVDCWFDWIAFFISNKNRCIGVSCECEVLRTFYIKFNMDFFSMFFYLIAYDTWSSKIHFMHYKHIVETHDHQKRRKYYVIICCWKFIYVFVFVFTTETETNLNGECVLCVLCNVFVLDGCDLLVHCVSVQSNCGDFLKKISIFTYILVCIRYTCR